MSLPINARERSQVMVIFALFVVLLMVLAGSAFDYASIVADDARLQNAVDAAALAGANALSRNAALADPGPAAEAVARTYLTQNGVVAGATTTIDVTFPLNPGTTKKENISLKVTRQHPTFFWKLIGINQVTMRGNGTAHSARAMLDIVLSLDTTASMYLAGGTTRNDFQSLRDAVDGFIQQVNPSDSDQRGPKISIARFAGVKCKWSSKATDTPHGDNDSLIDVTNAVGGLDEYTQGCTDDMEVLTDLTNRQPDLRQIANASGSVACPAGANPVAACPLQHVWNMAPKVSGTGSATGWISPAEEQDDCIKPNSTNYVWTNWVAAPCNPGYTGTKLPNAINVTNRAGYYAWDTSHGGRNSSTNPNDNARKILVMMTDGVDEAWPRQGTQLKVASWDSQFDTAAATIKNGANGVAGDWDDVEVYTVGYFCGGYSAGTWCASRLVDAATPQCPNSTNYSGLSTSAVDDRLRNASSSKSNSCDHYFPLKKGDDLPEMFQQLAGAISRGQLTD